MASELLEDGLPKLLWAVEQHEWRDDDQDRVVEDGVEEDAEIQTFPPTPGHVGVAEVEEDARGNAHDQKDQPEKKKKKKKEDFLELHATHLFKEGVVVTSLAQ